MPVAMSGASPEALARISLFWSGISARSTWMPVWAVKSSSIIFCMISRYCLERFTHTWMWEGSLLLVE